MKNREIIYIPAEKIHPHPDNPRKNLGDLSELSESIKKNGIMQNLTVIPGHWLTDERRTLLNNRWVDEDYTLIIGHRRFASGKLAGIKEYPCMVANDIELKEQVGTMLAENMQRNDLTIYEQAQGFQMMLDLGDTKEKIAEKTGFSQTTIQHRLNIAKLDQEKLKAKEEDESFQLSIKDLYELEKIKDIKARNEILENSRNSAELATRARNAAAEAKREETAEKIIKQLQKLGVEKAPETAKNEIYTSKWKEIKRFDLDEDAPKRIKLTEQKKMYYLISYRALLVITKKPKEEKVLTDYEIKKKEDKAKKKRIEDILKEASVRRKELIQDIISGKVKTEKEELKIIKLIWAALPQLGGYVYDSTIRRFFLEKEEYECTDEEKKKAREKAENLGALHQMLIVLHNSMRSTSNETYDYNLRFNNKRANALLKGYEALIPYGWYFTGEEEKVLDGTHELYKKSEEAAG